MSPIENRYEFSGQHLIRFFFHYIYIVNLCISSVYIFDIFYSTKRNKKNTNSKIVYFYIKDTVIINFESQNCF